MCNNKSLDLAISEKWSKYLQIRRALDAFEEIDEMEAHRRALYLCEREGMPNIVQIRKQAISKTKRKYGREISLPG